MSIRNCWLLVFFSFSISLLVFCLVFESGLGKSPSINLNRLIYILRSINVCFIYFEALFSAYKLIILSIYNVTICV